MNVLQNITISYKFAKIKKAKQPFNGAPRSRKHAHYNSMINIKGSENDRNIISTTNFAITIKKEPVGLKERQNKNKSVAPRIFCHRCP